MKYASATGSDAGRPRVAAAWRALLVALPVLSLAACAQSGGGVTKDDVPDVPAPDPGEEKTVLLTRKGESSIQVTESDVDGSQIVRIKTVFQGEENVIVLNIDQPVYEVEIPLSLEQVMPQAAAAQPRGPEGQFQDLLIAQWLQKAQEAMLAGDYNGALRQVDLVLQIRPNHIQANTMKGSVYYALGNYSLANEAWEYVLSLDPTNKEVQDFQNFLRNRPSGAPPPLPGAPPGTEGAQQVPPPPAGGGGGARQ